VEDGNGDGAVNEYRVKISIKNNLLLSAIEEAGFKGFGSQIAFSKFAGLEPNALSAMLTLKLPPINREGEFTQTAKDIMEALGAAPSDLWTDRQLCMRLKSNTGNFTIDERAVDAMIALRDEQVTLPSPEDRVMVEEVRRIVGDMVDGLSKRERQVIRMRFGLMGDEHARTLNEVAEFFGVSKERIHQTEGIAIRKLKHPDRVDKMVSAGIVDRPTYAHASPKPSYPPAGSPPTRMYGRLRWSIIVPPYPGNPQVKVIALNRPTFGLITLAISDWDRNVGGIDRTLLASAIRAARTQEIAARYVFDAQKNTQAA
jgi:RNA polymerase sigma factor (sigma-70 family)